MPLEFIDFTEGIELRSEDDRHYIEGYAVPWGKITDRAPMRECFERGAFADLVSSRAKVKLTDYNHSRDRVPVGYSSAVEDRAEGLWMRFRLNRTPEGRSALENSLEDVYQGFSVGFIARADDIRDGVRHVTSARLDHVSLVTEPAYADAKILAVRGAELADDLSRWRNLAAPRNLTIDTRDRVPQNLLMTKVHRRGN